ncbi:MAG: hypothetical protein RRZ84_07355 [Romboutsia sp.]
MKKIFGLILACIMMLGSFGQGKSFAESGDQIPKDIILKDYNEGIENGWIGEDVAYEEYENSVVESIRLEKALSNSEDFIQVPFTTMSSGDIIMTNGTSSAGLTGHAAIAQHSSSIIHIEGVGKKASLITTNEFKKKYSNNGKNWIRVYRHKTSTAGRQASIWALNNYINNSNHTYKITTDRKSTNETYCSKIVWQAYYYGAGSSSVASTSLTGIITPYGLDDSTIKYINHIGDM